MSNDDLQGMIDLESQLIKVYEKEQQISKLRQERSKMLKDDLDAMGPIRLAEVEEAQQAVVRAAKELEADGTITLGKGKDDVLV